MNTLIIGIGNPERGDDGVGPAVIDQLNRTAHDLDTACCSGDLTRLLDLWQAYPHVVLVDMLVTDSAEPGTVLFFDALQDCLPYELACSSHSMSLAQCIELARTLERLPPRMEIMGIVGARTTTGDTLSPAVRQAVEIAADKLLKHLHAESTSHA